MVRRHVEIPVEELDRLYRVERLTSAEIGSLFGVSEETIRQRLVEAGISRRSKSEAAKGPRPGARRLHITPEELDCLYNVEGLNTEDISHVYGVSRDLVRRRMAEFGIPRRDKSEAAIRHERAGFPGDPAEKAYLIGLRLGDLWVGRTSGGPESTTITAQCTTTRQEQIDLFQQVFGRYGHTNVTHSNSGNMTIVCHLNLSFDFLLPKEDNISDWILKDMECFVPFLAGYTDAEGCFCVPADGKALFRVQSYDEIILHQIHRILNTRFQVQCPKPRLATRKGYRCKDGYVRNQDCWSLTVKRKTSLYRLCTLLAPHLRHSKRRRDMKAVRHNVLRRGVEVGI